MDKQPKWMYRLESTTPDNGLWYDSDGNLVWGIGKLPDCISAEPGKEKTCTKNL